VSLLSACETLGHIPHERMRNYDEGFCVWFSGVGQLLVSST
jgi:hypothetical protein